MRVHLHVGFIFLCFRGGTCSLRKQRKQTNPRNLRNQLHGFRQGTCRRSSSPKPGQNQGCTIEHRPLLWICLIDFLPFAHPYMHLKIYTPSFVSITEKHIHRPYSYMQTFPDFCSASFLGMFSFGNRCSPLYLVLGLD